MRQHPAPFAGCDDRRAERLGVVHDVPVRAVGGGEGFSDARRAPRRDGFGIVRAAAASCVDRRIVVEAFEDGADERVRRVGIVQHLRGPRGKIRGLIMPGGLGTIGAIVGARLLPCPGAEEMDEYIMHRSGGLVSARRYTSDPFMYRMLTLRSSTPTMTWTGSASSIRPAVAAASASSSSPPPPLTLGFGDHLRVELGERGEEAGVADEALALLRVGADEFGPDARDPRCPPGPWRVTPWSGGGARLTVWMLIAHGVRPRHAAGRSDLTHLPIKGQSGITRGGFDES